MNNGNTPSQPNPQGEEEMSEAIRQSFLQKACQYLLNKTCANLPQAPAPAKPAC